jgi:hypothetical protein
MLFGVKVQANRGELIDASMSKNRSRQLTNRAIPPRSRPLARALVNTDGDVSFLGRTLTHITRLSHPHTLVHRLSFQGTPYNKILVLDLVELIDNLVQPSRLDNSSEIQLTLFFIDSILAGLSAPVAKPKSVNFTCPVESTKKF